MKLKFLSIVFLVFVLSGFVFANDFSVKIDVVKAELFPYDEFAIYNVTVTNEKINSDYFSISLMDPSWYMAPPKSMMVPGNSSKTLQINIKPIGQTPYQIYSLPLSIRSRDEDVVLSQSISVFYKTVSDPKKFPARVKIIADSPDDFVPKDPLHITVDVRNINPIAVEGGQLIIESKLVSDVRDVELAPSAEKTLSFLLDVDPLTIPGKYPFVARFFYNNKTISEYEFLVDVNSYSDINKDKSSKNFLLGLKQVEYYNLTNKGNVKRVADLKKEVSFFDRLFSYSNFDYNVIKENGVKEILWKVELESNESVELRYTINYFWFVLFLLIVLVISLIYYFTRSPITLVKETKILSHTEE